MFIEVDVQAGDNCEYSLFRIFSAVGDPRPVIGVNAPGPGGISRDLEVTGWSAEGSCQAYAVAVEDSGEGRALLVYGGDEGVRLKARDSVEPWSIHSGDQWGEPCLLLDMDSPVQEAQQ